jgi:hypothetical protein
MHGLTNPKCEKLLQRYRWLPKSKELISQVADEDPLYSVNIRIQKIDLSVGPDLLNSLLNSSLISTLNSK